jgi:PIN like domain
MRDQYRGFYPPLPEELSRLWGEGLVVFDANTLLNLYRYTDQTATEFLATLMSIQDRIWLPHQAGLEFHRLRLGVIDQQAKAYEAIVGAIESAKKTVAGEVMRFKRHSLLDADRLVEQYENAMSPIVETLKEAQARQLDVAPSSPLHDPLLDAVTEIFNGRVGKGFSALELEKIYDEGRDRYAGEVPPGYKDINKGEPGCFGDLVIWKEILRKGSDLKSPTIFVTDDKKEDWWRIVRGQTVGPRVELIDEYFDASQARIHFYGPGQFLRFAKERVSAVVSDESIGEVEAVSRRESDDHLRAFVLARQDELRRRRDSTERVLQRSEIAHRVEIEYREVRETASALESFMTDLMERDAVLAAMEEDLHIAWMDSGTEEEKTRLRLQTETTAEERATNRARIAEMKEDLRRSDAMLQRRVGPGTNYVDRYRSRLNKIDRALSEVDEALRELGSQGSQPD